MWSKKAEMSSSFNTRRPNANTNKALMQALARDRVFDLTGRTGVLFDRDAACCRCPNGLS
jgi:hypothetical protein